MNNLKIIISFFLLILLVSCKDDNLPYDSSKLSNETELNFALTEKRGIIDKNGLIYIVNNKQKTLIAYENRKVKWEAEIIKNANFQIIGKPEIRYIKLENDIIFVVFGKHAFANVSINDGQIEYLGQD